MRFPFSLFSATQPHNVSVISGQYLRLDLQTPYRVGTVEWKKEVSPDDRKKRSAFSDDSPLLESEKFAKATSGDLIITNLTLADEGIYVAYDAHTNTELIRYKVDVANGTSKHSFLYCCHWWDCETALMKLKVGRAQLSFLILV